MLTRRQWLERSALLSLSPLVPTFLHRTARAAGEQPDRRALVVIQLDGGNDGLNTVIPYRDEEYARLRPNLRLDKKEVIKLNDEVALHPAMMKAGKLFEDGRLAIVQGVGYPNPDRSHFRSMAIWQTARMDEADHDQFGWLGRALDAGAQPAGRAQAVFAAAGSLPRALWGRRSAAVAVSSPDDFSLEVPEELLDAATGTPGDASELARLVEAESREAFSTSRLLTKLLAHPAVAGGTTYPDTRLANQLKMISALVKSGSAASVFYTTQSGYDTHAVQLNDHRQLLQELSGALAAFLGDLSAAGLADQVLVMAFSEFGRRAAENASQGTDHGAAAPVLLAGTKLASGIFGPVPNLADLQDGDVKMAIDFRQVYASILDQWLNVRPAAVLSAEFEQLTLLTT